MRRAALRFLATQLWDKEISAICRRSPVRYRHVAPTVFLGRAYRPQRPRLGLHAAAMMEPLTSKADSGLRERSAAGMFRRSVTAARETHEPTTVLQIQSVIVRAHAAAAVPPGGTCHGRLRRWPVTTPGHVRIIEPVSSIDRVDSSPQPFRQPGRSSQSREGFDPPRTPFARSAGARPNFRGWFVFKSRSAYLASVPMPLQSLSAFAG